MSKIERTLIIPGEARLRVCLNEYIIIDVDPYHLLSGPRWDFEKITIIIEPTNVLGAKVLVLESSKIIIYRCGVSIWRSSLAEFYRSRFDFTIPPAPGRLLRFELILQQ